MDQRSSWQPQEKGVIEICSLLQESKAPSADQARVFEQLQRCSQFPDFNNYLVFILCRSENQSIVVRQAAGLLLKNNLRASYTRLPPVYQQYIKTELLSCLGISNKDLRATVGSVISAVIQQGQLWPDLLQGILQCLESNDYNHMEGALDALYKICEDTPMELDAEVPGLGQRPVNVFIPLLLKFFSSPHVMLRRLSLGAVNQFIPFMPQALFINMDGYLQGLFALSNDTAPEVRKLVCSALVQLVEVTPDFLEPHMQNIITYMLQANNDPDVEVALESCEFWSAFCQARLPLKLLRDALPRLIGVLLTNMNYADDDEALLDSQDDDDVPDTEQNMKPRFHQSRFHGNEGEDDDDDNDAEIITAWNLRKCSAAGLDILSTQFGDEILPLLMPLVQKRLENSAEDKWKDREAAVLALGAVAEGCINGLLPHLPQMVEFLVPLLDDGHPLVKSITCWTLSRYSKWIVKGVGQATGVSQFDHVLRGLLRQVIDSNKQVQEAACSAFATLEEEAAEELSPRLEVILQHLMFAFSKYQRHNLRILYDAIGTLADAVGGDLNEPQYLNILMPPLLAKWQQLPDSDKDLCPLFECFTSIAQALGSGFAQYAEPIFTRCINLIRAQQVAKVDTSRAGVQYDREFIICSLDLLSGLAEGLGSRMDALVSRSDLRDVLLHCCSDEAPDVLQSAFALLGDLAKACPGHLQPRIGDFLRFAAQQLEAKVNVSVINNACWAIGEIAIKVGKDIAPIVLSVVTCLVPLLAHVEGYNKSMMENSAITLGRLAWVCPDLVAPHLEHFMKIWCQALAMVCDEIEKEDAFHGLCAMVRGNPAGAAKFLGSICEAVGSWREIRSSELRSEISQVLHGLKQMLGSSWEQYFNYLDPAIQEKLQKKYGL